MPRLRDDRKSLTGRTDDFVNFGEQGAVSVYEGAGCRDTGDDVLGWNVVDGAPAIAPNKKVLVQWNDTESRWWITAAEV